MSFPINLGIDFGTSFSKICIRGPGSVGAAVFPYGIDKSDHGVITSAIGIDEEGMIHLPAPDIDQPKISHVRYLKMALADLASLQIFKANGLDQQDIRSSVRGLASAYISWLIGMGRDYAKEIWAEHIGGEEPLWSANVGVPVAYYDSPIREIFQEVLAVAWQWHCEGYVPPSFTEAQAKYARTLSKVNPSESPCQTYPEIAAAVLSFANSRAARPGVYIYFDVGGGTLDGVGFKLERSDGLPIVKFYTGEVESLGVMAIAEKVAADKDLSSGQTPNIEDLSESILDNKGPCEIIGLDDFRRKIQKMVSSVIMYARWKDDRNWREELVQSSELPRPYWRRPDDEAIRPLIIFMGGGGYQSWFYCDATTNTYVVHQHGSAGIPPYALSEAPKPSDLEMKPLLESEYHRYLIAYGLSVPLGEGPDFSLPSQHHIPPPIKTKQSGPGYDYSDTKDMFD